MAHVLRLLDAGLPGEQIGVITPYNGQVAALRELRGDREAAVEISSVDGFQGMHVNLRTLLAAKPWSLWLCVGHACTTQALCKPAGDVMCLVCQACSARQLCTACSQHQNGQDELSYTIMTDSLCTSD